MHTVEELVAEIKRLGAVPIRNLDDYSDVTAALADLALRLARAVSA